MGTKTDGKSETKTEREIYFGGAIRGGRDDADLYARLIEVLNRHGTVLTEHVGTDDVKEREDAAGRSERAIHDRDMDWLRRADVVIAEVTTPSLGVGYEIGRAVAWETPVLALFRPGGEHALSAMVRGNPAVTVREYDAVEAVVTDLVTFVKRHDPESDGGERS